MGKNCVVCGAVQNKNSPLSFHRFPKNEALHSAWKKACGLDTLDHCNENTVVCSKHFLVDDYDDSWPTRKLLKTAIPSPTLRHKTADMVAVHAGPSKEATMWEISISERSEVTSSSKIKSPAEDSTPLREIHNVRYVGDLRPTDFATPRKAKRHLDFVKERFESQRKKLKVLGAQKKRLETRICNVRDLLEHLRNQQLLSEEAFSTIMEDMPTTLEEILKRQLLSKNRKYDPNLRAFSLTLHFYSSSAYNYVRKQFNNLLPHPDTIRRWYMIVKGEPGFTKEAFAALSLKQQQQTNTIIVNIVIDEMSIRQRVQYECGKYYGYVDFGAELQGDGDTRPLATNALVFMAVALNSHWKIPLGYFLIQGLNAMERANLLTTCLQLLHDTQIKCSSVTFDGTSTNIAMCNELGTRYIYDDKFQTWFAHVNTAEKIHTFWDACHMIKLVRNTLADQGVIYSPEGEPIKWQYIVKLYEHQKQEGLHAATKLSSQHIHFQNNRMKVRLAVQVLSASVSAALLFCKSLDMKDFENCDATATFCLNMNDMFDILNCKSLYSKQEWNRPLSSTTFNTFKSRIDVFIKYLSELRDFSGKLLIYSKRKTGFLGLIVCLSSYLDIYQELVVTGYLKYILSYKFSQDHLEMFFSAVRQRGGWNNNPTALQFRTGYIRLLVKHQITAVKTGNCSILDATTILHVGAGTIMRTNDTIVDDDEEEVNILEEEHDYFANIFNLSPFISDIIKYISGFVARRVNQHISCEICKAQLISDQCTSQLILLKKRGKLITPSEDVIQICLCLERLIKQYQNVLFSKRNITQFFISKLVPNLNVFNNDLMNDHISSQDMFDNHKFQLITMCCTFYMKVRLHYEAKLKNDATSCRQKFTKLILFRHE